MQYTIMHYNYNYIVVKDHRANKIITLSLSELPYDQIRHIKTSSFSNCPSFIANTNSWDGDTFKRLKFQLAQGIIFFTKSDGYARSYEGQPTDTTESLSHPITAYDPYTISSFTRCECGPTGSDGHEWDDNPYRLADNSQGELAPARLVIRRQAPMPRARKGALFSPDGARQRRMHASAPLAASNGQGREAATLFGC